MAEQRLEQRELLRAEQPLPADHDRRTRRTGHRGQAAEPRTAHGPGLVSGRTAAPWYLGVRGAGDRAGGTAGAPVRHLAQVYLPTAGQLGERGLELLATGPAPHYTIQLGQADDKELGELLAALGPAQANPQYGRSSIWREEG